MISSELIFIHKYISKTIWDNDIHILNNGENIAVIIRIYGARAMFILFYDDQDTESKK